MSKLFSSEEWQLLRVANLCGIYKEAETLEKRSRRKGVNNRKKKGVRKK